MRARQPVTLVPILVGSFHPFFDNGATPAADPLLSCLLETLAAATAGKRVVVVASGDLAHVGPAFGGRPLDAEARAAVAAADAALIDQMGRGDMKGFFEAIRSVRDRNNVCGVAPIYLTMSLTTRLVGQVTGELAGYATCPADPYDTSTVTVGGMLFTRQRVARRAPPGLPPGREMPVRPGPNGNDG
jgi:AmmeMemoRadiSam system protein B